MSNLNDIEMVQNLCLFLGKDNAPYQVLKNPLGYDSPFNINQNLLNGSILTSYNGNHVLGSYLQGAAYVFERFLDGRGSEMVKAM